MPRHNDSIKELELMMGDFELEIDPLRTGRSRSNRKPSTSPTKENSLTVATLLEQPSALTGQLELYIPPTKSGKEGVYAERFFVLASRSVFMFATWANSERPLGSIELTPSTFVVERIQSAAELSFELVSMVGSRMQKTWVLRSRTMANKKLWIEMIEYGIAASIDEAAKVAAGSPIDPEYLLQQHEEYNRILNSRLQNSITTQRRGSESSVSPSGAGRTFMEKRVGSGNSKQDNIFFEASRKSNLDNPPKEVANRRVATAIMDFL
ncbi:UNVERIFIED_CONTAM: hypothetical protein HDU68_008527 [Siphonaria sp. JEL0065]|nr:hypothetical protein HDU68_008527 [Siphonaria sp. JEL0065]